MKTPFTRAFQPIFKPGKYLPFPVTSVGPLAPRGLSR